MKFIKSPLGAYAQNEKLRLINLDKVNVIEILGNNSSYDVIFYFTENDKCSTRFSTQEEAENFVNGVVDNQSNG